MIVLNSIEDVIAYLEKGYLLAKVTIDYPGMTNPCLVAGRLMEITKNDWWYVLVKQEHGNVYSVLKKELFISLFRHYYLKLQRQVSNDETYYSLNRECAIQEIKMYQHKIDSWKESMLRPT